MLKDESYQRLFAAIDESNHGFDNEIFAIVISPFQGDADFFQSTSQLRATRKTANQRLWIPLRKRDFRYAIVNRAHYEKYGQHQLIREVTRELVRGIEQEYGGLDLFIDGHLTSKQRGAVKREVAKVAFLKYPEIGIHSVPKRKDENKEFKANYLIQISDCLANYLFRNYTNPELEKGKISRRRVRFD